jgi:hypothetical protein
MRDEMDPPRLFEVTRAIKQLLDGSTPYSKNGIIEFGFSGSRSVVMPVLV